MADLRIVDAPVLLQESITDDVKMPTGGLGNFSIRLGDILWYVITKEQLADKNYVDTSSKGVKDSLDVHIADKANPHNVTKAQVGLGNVDNTADIDKPISNATKSAIITATTDMATKTYVNSKDGDLTTLTTTDKTSLAKAINEVVSVKADKATTLVGYGISDAYTKSEIDTNYGGVKTLYNKNVEAGAGANGWTADLVLDSTQLLTQAQINAAQRAIFAGKKIKQIAGAIRNNGTGWTFITDTLHNPINATSVTVENGIDLKVNFDKGVKVISGMVVCDESYSRIGLQVGASVATNALAIRGYLPLEFSVTTDGSNAPIVNAIAEIKSRITASRSGTKIRINHTGAVNDYPQVTPLSGSPNAKPIDVTSTSMNILQETGSSPYCFRIWYASGAWNFTTNMSGVTLNTSTFATTGDIKFDFTTALTGNDYLVQSTSDRYKGSISKIYSSGLSGFTVRFVDPATNAYMTSVPADAVVDSVIQYGIQKNSVNTATVLPSGTYHVKRGLTPVYWDEIKSPDSYGGSANLWFIAIIEY